jgi:hypothetical protein
MLANFGLTDHVDGSPVQHTFDLVLTDFVVVSWYNTTVRPSTLEIFEERKYISHNRWSGAGPLQFKGIQMNTPKNYKN